MKNIGRIFSISKPLYPLFGGLGSLIVLTALLELIAPLLSKLVVDEIVAKVQGKGGDMGRLVYYIALVFGVGFITVALRSVSDRMGDHLSGRMRKYLTEKFYTKVLSLPQSYFDSEVSGKIVNQLNRGIAMVYSFMNNMSNFVLPTILQSLFTIGVMAFFNVWVALFTFALFPIYLTLSTYSARRWGMEEMEKNKIEDYTRGRIQEVIGNIKLVKGFSNEAREFDIVSRNLTKSNIIYARQSNWYHVFDFFRNFSLQIIFAIVSLIIFYNTFTGELTIGEMVLLLQLFNQARIPLFAMSYILQSVQQAEAGSKEFFEILELPSTEPFDKKKVYEAVKNPSIEFKDVSFKYEKADKTVLNDVSFKLEPKERVALVGHSGVGKSTIVSLIMKLYSPESGDIYLNDKPYSELEHSFIRHNIALVFQENELFSTTIRENVSYGRDATEKEVVQALKLANAWDFVKNLPKGIESEVGERGVRLSGGQKQRIQIARAILKDAPILILDEATSSLDSKSEREVQQALENLMKNRLVIIIAHRFSTIQNVDKIIVVDDGKIVDHGTPKELSTRKGVYSDLLNYQIEGNKKLLESFEIY